MITFFPYLSYLRGYRKYRTLNRKGPGNLLLWWPELKFKLLSNSPLLGNTLWCSMITRVQIVWWRSHVTTACSGKRINPLLSKIYVFAQLGPRQTFTTFALLHLLSCDNFVWSAFFFVKNELIEREFYCPLVLLWFCWVVYFKLSQAHYLISFCHKTANLFDDSIHLLNPARYWCSSASSFEYFNCNLYSRVKNVLTWIMFVPKKNKPYDTDRVGKRGCRCRQ